jgi:hypothetical protein
MRRSRGIPAIAALASLAIVPPATAQEGLVEEVELPAEVAAEVIAYLNRSETVRFDGPARVPEGGLIQGDVGVIGGPVILFGTIRGDLVIVNGDVEFGEGGRVEGDVTVVGGRVVGGFPSSVGGTMTVYQQSLAFAERDGRISFRGGDDDDERGAALLWGRSRFMIRSSGTYNRVEGLPVLFGPIVEGGSANPWRVDVMGLWRSESGLTLDDEEMGYLFRAQKRIGADPTLILGASYHSLIWPVASEGLSDLESSLSTFLFHRDYRDYVERTGWSASVGLQMDPITVRLTYRDEDHGFVSESSPWTFRKNDDPWRPQPLVGEGPLRSLVGELVLDDRNDPENPSDGWYLSASWTRGLSGDLTVPETVRPFVPEPIPVPARPLDVGLTAGSLELRRYNRVAPDAELNLRAVYGGSLDGAPLPPQFQQALGGEGTLPGYGLFDLDCGARSDRLELERPAFDDDDPRHAVHPYYGCDRALLFQVEYRHRLPVDLDLGGGEDDRWNWYPAVDPDLTWILFFDAGRGWSEDDESLNTRTVWDVGTGLTFGDLGAYWAWPLEGSDRGLNFFIRLQRRF